MTAIWARNEVQAFLRRCDLIVYQDGGATLAPRGTNFIALGIVWISGTTSPDYALALGTMTNKRRALIVADFTITATDTVNDRITKVAHGLETGDGPLRPTSTAGGVVSGTDYWVIKFDNDQISLATTLLNAYAGTKLDITATVGSMIFQDTVSTKRGLDGLFTYEATQVETDTSAPSASVVVEGTGYLRANGGGAYTSVMIQSDNVLFNSLGEGSLTYGDIIRAMFSILAGKVTNYTTGTYAFRDPTTGAKTRVTFTTDATGRLTVVFGDLTP